MADPVYLDHNATAPVRPEAARAVAEALAEVGNASSVHRFGRGARRRLEDAREAVAALVGARASQVIFTGGGTEANNLALRGLAGARPLVSAGEHDCVLRARDDAESIPLTADGRTDLDALQAMLADDARPAVVSIMLANNETGVLNDVARAAGIAHAAGALVHCDAVQAPGKIAVDVRDLGVDLLTLSAHKIGGPQGVGALVIPGEVSLTKLMGGGGQERGYRPGTENVAAAAGFGVAAEMAGRETLDHVAAWRDRLEREVRTMAPQAVIHGGDAPRLPTTSCIGLPGVNAETQVMALDLAGVAVSSGSACSSGKVHPSHVLKAMGLDEDAAGEAIRVSLGWTSREADVDRFLDAWGKLARRHAPEHAA
ncbi:cysteine desulfurase [Limimonas halophila]|uniref:Cysteine desulfurase n=1 Tax=Limimonas halophila TaxID=1082479 RepID=A0A1G7QPM6_9PROT|nr:cysteine desulfurase family protein [Limimonas halophila]SDG00475.1 cysteine desulfurase [Limimonas halophila]